ncbi:MAG TPA: DEAD/DEAH box helicase [Longimicrobiales bacterium]
MGPLDSAGSTTRFPLFERAARAGVLDDGNALIVAPTGTGKSYIGREVIRRALARGEPGVHAYLVPFRALAAEIHDDFEQLFAGTDVRLRIVTGEHRDALAPEAANVVVATYESFGALLTRPGFQPGIVVADEVHLIADDHRGPVVEGLFARLLAGERARGLCALSAVVGNGAELAEWLGLRYVEGGSEDRPVPLELEPRWADDLHAELERVLARQINREQALVFCSSRPAAEKMADELAELVAAELPVGHRNRLGYVAEGVVEDDPSLEDLASLILHGVAYHHAGLPKPVRRRIEAAYRERLLRLLTATPTLAAGVNLPAGLVVVRDVFRFDTVRGVGRRVLLPSGEVLNMLGRAARPLQVAAGRGIALIDQSHRRDRDVQRLVQAIEAGYGEDVRSRLTDSFEALMRFVLGVIVDRGEATLDDVTGAFSKTLAHHQQPSAITTLRPFKEDLMEDIPSYAKVVAAGGSIRLADYAVTPDGVRATVASDHKRYEVTLGVTGVQCTCPAASRYYRHEICKHAACAIHDLLFDFDVDAEAHNRALYSCGHVFGPKLDLGTRLTQALELLTAWKLIERVPTGWRATPVGAVAAATRFDLLLVHEAMQRIEAAGDASYRDVARWALEDYHADERKREKWARAVEQWLDEVDEREIPLPEKYRGDFERGLDDLASVCRLYENAATALGRPELAAAARDAAGALRYGVAPELVPLMALALPQLGRARARHLYERGIRRLEDLAAADADAIADPRRLPPALVRSWIERAREMARARSTASGDGTAAPDALDDLVAIFRIDPAALTH